MNFLKIPYLITILFAISCSSMKEVELYEFVDKRINSFEYNDIFIDSELSGVWGVKQNSCKSISFDTLNNFIGKDHLHIKWNEKQECKYLGFGFKWANFKSKNLLPIGTAQDHKRAYDNDLGPNTGGMGAYSPAPVLSEEVMDLAITTIIQPTIDEMRSNGTPYEGVIFAGLMIKNNTPKLIEYNVRFGDPECQALMIRLGAQILDLILACCMKRLNKTKVNWAEDHSITVVMATKGYPGSYINGTEIHFSTELKDDSFNQLFHAGTKRAESKLTGNGGRVLNITTRGNSLEEAHKRAYENIKAIDWPEGFYRTDIGWRAL